MTREQLDLLVDYVHLKLRLSNSQLYSSGEEFHKDIDKTVDILNKLYDSVEIQS